MVEKLTEGEVIGLAMRRVRQRKNKTLREVEEAAELGQGALSTIERGRRQPRWGTIRKISQAIGIHPKEIMAEVERIEQMEAEG